MAELVRFRSEAALTEHSQIKVAAAQLIDELGDVAGYRIGCLARSGGLDDVERRRLSALDEEIERQQGFGWFFADDRRSARDWRAA